MKKRVFDTDKGPIPFDELIPHETTPSFNPEKEEARIDENLRNHPLTTEEIDALKNLDEMTQKKVSKSADKTHYGLEPITQEQVDADAIARVRKMMDEASARYEAQNDNETKTENDESSGLLKLPERPKKKSILKRITGIFKRAA